MLMSVLSLGICLSMLEDLRDEPAGPVDFQTDPAELAAARFEAVRNAIRERSVYVLELTETVQLASLEPTVSLQFLRRNQFDFELDTPNTTAVLLDNRFGFMNSTKPQRCVWRPVQDSFFDEIGRLKSVVTTFLALHSDTPTSEILLKCALGLDKSLKFGETVEVVHKDHGRLDRLVLETERGSTFWDIHPETNLVMAVSTKYAPPETPESFLIQRTIECNWSFPDRIEPAIAFDPEDRVQYPTVESVFTWESLETGQLPTGGMPGDPFPIVQLNTLSGEPWSSKVVSGKSHLYLFWNSENYPQRMFIRSLQGLQNNPKGCDITCINVAEPGAVEADRWRKASEAFASLRVPGARSLFDPTVNLYSGLQIGKLPILIRVGEDGVIADRWDGELHQNIAAIMNAVLAD